MTRLVRRFAPSPNVRLVATIGTVIWVAALFFAPVRGEQLLQLQNGLVIRGNQAEIASLKEGFGAAATNHAAVRPIWLVDDGLRRIYLHGRGMVAGKPIDIGDPAQSIEFWQPRPLGGKAIAGLGNILDVSPFTPLGRRLLKVRGPEGPVTIIQGIAELNPRYARLVALKAPDGHPNISWDMRVASRSIDSATLNQIFSRRLDQHDLNARLQAVRFFIAAERYGDAKQALQQIIQDFPEETDLAAQLVALTERQALQLLAEAEIRAAAGQPQLARDILTRFPVQSVGRVTRLRVQDALAKLDDAQQTVATLVERLQGQVSLLDDAQRTALAPIVDEIAGGLSADTLARLSDYSRLGANEDMPLDNRVALAVAGWLLGSGSGEQNLNIAGSLVAVRDLVAEYLASEDAARRTQILASLQNLEGAIPEYVDRMLPLLLPSHPLPEDAADPVVPGMFAIKTDQFEYLIQLPPEYNPLREYPCVVALHESRSSPAGQLEWWSGVYNSETAGRHGHGTRNGFIVVAPVWSRPGQRLFEYTPREHQRVLTALRDAMRRSAIDADRVFLAGHGEGATAAWDIALAHPDLWAGMIAISGSPSKTVLHYKLNSQYVPLYIVMGELDQTRADGGVVDPYMSFKHDAMVVRYRGRGREYFYDEIPRLFEWMTLPAHRRRPMPTEFEVSTMRDGDQFFWWLEVGELNSSVAIDPILWDQAKRLKAGKVSLTIGSDNLISVGGPSETFTVQLRPHDQIDMAEEFRIRAGSRTQRVDFDGTLDHLLEDVRRRADRKRGFWMSVTVP